MRTFFRGDGRKRGPWVLWLGWRYRGEFSYKVHNSYHHLSFKFFFIDWVSG